MSEIIKLDQALIDKISAGEVIERPSSVVKELLENAIDASSTSIDIEIQNGGIDLIKITDDGSGISPEELPLALERHATSKIKNIDDLFYIQSFGFRGEALASIASVSRVTITSKTKKNPEAYELKVTGAEVSQNVVGRGNGTTIEVKDLFYNTPARKKFLKSPRYETRTILDWVHKIALVYPSISFRLTIDGKLVDFFQACSHIELNSTLGSATSIK